MTSRGGQTWSAGWRIDVAWGVSQPSFDDGKSPLHEMARAHRLAPVNIVSINRRILEETQHLPVLIHMTVPRAPGTYSFAEFWPM